ncbi:MAG: hemerythrin domain-containing protein [Jatrophihabitans sp.]|nr:MAG: hemerythrin domain-containing protein [Jatrophihabitans sp.]
MITHENGVERQVGTAPDHTVDGHGADEHGAEQIAEQIRAHHAGMVADLDRLSAAVRDAVPGEQGEARRALAEWFATVLVPHAEEEEVTTYRAAAALTEGRLLIESMVREHVLIKRLVALFGESGPAAAGAYGRAVFEAFSSHQAKENELILTLLVDAAPASLAAALGGTHENQTGHQPHAHH